MSRIESPMLNELLTIYENVADSMDFLLTGLKKKKVKTLISVFNDFSMLRSCYASQQFFQRYVLYLSSILLGKCTSPTDLLGQLIFQQGFCSKNY